MNTGSKSMPTSMATSCLTTRRSRAARAATAPSRRGAARGAGTDVHVSDQPCSIHPQEHATGLALPDEGNRVVHLVERKLVRHQAVERELAGLQEPHVSRNVHVRLGAAAVRSGQHLLEVQ